MCRGSEHRLPLRLDLDVLLVFAQIIKILGSTRDTEEDCTLEHRLHSRNLIWVFSEKRSVLQCLTALDELFHHFKLVILSSFYCVTLHWVASVFADLTCHHVVDEVVRTLGIQFVLEACYRLGLHPCIGVLGLGCPELNRKLIAPLHHLLYFGMCAVVVVLLLLGSCQY